MAKAAKSKTSSTRTGKRREELRRNLPRPTTPTRELLHRPEVINAGALLVGFILLASLLVVWSRNQVTITIGQVMTDTRLSRLDYTVVDEEATELRREEAGDRAPRVYRLNGAYLDELQRALNGLPRAVEGKTTLEEINEQLIEEYQLTAEGLTALQQYVAEGEPTAQWRRWVERVIAGQLLRHPILTSEEYQQFSRTLNSALVTGDDQPPEMLDDAQPIDLSGDLRDRLAELVARAGFPDAVAPFVTARLAWNTKPTFIFDPAVTRAIKQAAQQTVAPVTVHHHRGEVIYRRGDQLSASQLDDVLTEQQQWQTHAGVWQIWFPRLGILGIVTILLGFTGGFVLISYPRVIRNTARVIALGLLLAGMLALTVTLTAQAPNLLYPAAIAPTLFVATIILLAYDQRLALFLATVHCALVTLALDQGVGWFILLLVGCGTMIAQLGEVRHRNTLIRAAMVTAVALGAGTLLIGALVSPPVAGIATQIIANAAWAAAASLVVGFLVLGILPSIEKLFDITTGMTLVELRDPSHTLLRQLQQRAPGTYNHSLQVANIAEAAADAIGANSLLIYVGALYHDIGKMNKPEYFVENQAGGFNKHSRLRPAMSLLVIVGHVKDGVELAREYGLPRAIQHFIESHHGTTLVEYFYHAAKSQAEADDRSSPEEVEFRYPGPRPRTKEAAILMLADVVESATRAMAEPNPSRIESLVREMARRRLLDDQFDECDLTFRELSLIEDAMIARLCAIHHGRISYPTKKAEAEPAESAQPAPAKHA